MFGLLKFTSAILMHYSGMLFRYTPPNIFPRTVRYGTIFNKIFKITIHHYIFLYLIKLWSVPVVFWPKFRYVQIRRMERTGHVIRIDDSPFSRKKSACGRNKRKISVVKLRTRREHWEKKSSSKDLIKYGSHWHMTNAFDEIFKYLTNVLFSLNT